MENYLAALSEQLAAVVESAALSVVAVQGRPRIHSSGLLWRPGVVVTADHTLRRRENIRVALPSGKAVPAELAGRDPGTDLAVLRAETGEVPSIREAGSLRPGNLLLVVGRSPESGINAAAGVISSSSGPWNTWRGGKMDRFIRLDASVYPGASGGAVLNTSGELIGVATGALSRFSTLAIPTETIERVAGQLLEKGHIARGFLGVGLQPVPLPANLAEPGAAGGLIVLSVEPDSPAAQAGILIGDILLRFDGKALGGATNLQALLGPESVGKTAPVRLLRAGAITEASIKVGERPARRT